MVHYICEAASFGAICLLAASLCVASLSTASLDAQPPGKKGKGDKGPPRGAEILTVRGTVREFTTAPKGEKDGVILTDGTVVHWPPHLEDRFSNIVAKGDKVKVVGARWKRVPEGEIPRITEILAPDGTTGAPTKPAASRAGGEPGVVLGETVTATGNVREFTTAKKGEVDGFVLSDGQVDSLAAAPDRSLHGRGRQRGQGPRDRIQGNRQERETKLEVSTSDQSANQQDCGKSGSTGGYC